MASGDELLKTITIHALTDTANETTVAGGHTYTIISISLCEQDGDDETFSIYVDDGSNDVYLYLEQPLPGKTTFVHNDKLILEAADKLGIVCTAGNTDVIVSYLDQEL